MYQPPNNEVLLQACFFSSRQAQQSLQEYVQETRSLSASISVGQTPEQIEVLTFLNGRHGLARQAPFRKFPSTMEEAIEVALVEEQSYNSASVTPCNIGQPKGLQPLQWSWATRMLPATIAVSVAI